MTEVTLPLVLVTGLIDSINPCAIGVLVVLLACLTQFSRSRNMVLKVGVIYVAVVYVTYFLSGLGLLTVIQSVGLSLHFYYLAAVIAIIAGLVEIRDAFHHENPILRVRGLNKKRLRNFVRKASIPSAIVLGVAVSMFELPCTGAVYFAIIGMLATGAWENAVGWLLIYNVMFVLPLIVIVALVYQGTKAETVRKFKDTQKKWMRLGMGILLIAMGLWMISSTAV